MIRATTLGAAGRPCYSPARMAGQAQVRTFRAAEHPNPIELIRDGVRDIWSRRRLTRYLVEADLHKHGADTLLGNIWWFLDPLLQMLVYVILVAVIFQRATPDYPLFIFAAILPWKWFSSSINDAITSVTSRERIIKQVNFPKIVLPVASTAAGIASFAFGLVPLVALMVVFYADRISPFLLLLPVVAAVQLIFTLACAVFVSAANVFFRDIANVARHLLRVWFYLSPALYSIDDLSGNPTLQTLMALNPWTALFESYRDLIYEGTWPVWGPLAILALVSVVLFGLATIFFKRLEPAFAKVL
jgi:ABC-type polysaccharide/polyol phosphate export permease